MSRFVRPSKYRHVYGEKAKVHYENVKISGSAWDTDVVSAGGKYIAVNWQASGGGAFSVLPIFSPYTAPSPSGFPTKLPDILPLARGHTGPVLDTAWSPFDDNLVVSGSEDGKVCIWKIQDSLFEGWGEDGWTPEDLSPDAKLNAGGRKVGQVVFHPTASNVLTTASGDHLVRIWDIEQTDSPKLTLKGHTDSIQSLAWNAVGTTLATTCRDKKLRLFDPRAGSDPVRVADGHAGVKGSRVVWLGDRDRIVTTGFSRMSDRQLGLWDTSSLTNMNMESIDTSAGIMMPFFAEGNDVLFLAGKGDGNVRYYEYEGDSLHYLTEYKSSDPQRGMTFLPRRALDVEQNEIARAFKLYGSSVEPVSYIVPRKAESFQSDIFPPAVSAEPAMSASDFFAGKSARPKMIDLETKAVTSSSNEPIAAAPSSAPAPAPAPAATPSEPTKSKSAPAVIATPAPLATQKDEPKSAFKEEFTPDSTPAATPRISEPESFTEPQAQAKSLEIEQPESEDEQPHPSPAAASQAAKSIPAPASNGEVAVPQDKLLVKKLSEAATTPTRGSALAAGYDLYAAEDKTVPARGKALVDLQLSIAVPEGTYGRVAPRSGLASKHSIHTGAGVIDADYRGPVMVLLFNLGEDDFSVKKGDRIAQLVLEKICLADIVETDDLEATARGAGGFGSTGGFGKP